MPLNAVPAVDVNICSGWTEQQVDAYNKLPFYFAKMQVDRRKSWLIWDKMVGKRKWTPNQGTTMRAVRKDPSPHIRQFANPQPMTSTAKKDVINIKEIKTDEVVYHHKFESLVLPFLPSFQDFMDHVDDNSTDIMEKMERFEDLFIRGRIFHNSPNVWLPDAPGGELQAAPIGNGDTASPGKTSAFLQAMVALIGQPGNLSLSTCNSAVTILQEQLRVPPFKGGGPAGDDNGLSDLYVLVLSNEAWNQFTFDPYLQQNKNCNLDVVNQSFKGKLFGKVTCRIEDLPLRFKADGTFVAPETREGNPAAYNEGETLPNPDYVTLTTSPYEIAFMVGAQGYEAIEVGPPPSKFASSGMPNGFGKMVWNGEVILTKNFLIECLDDEGNTKYETNNYGEYLKFISHATYGILPKQRRNVLPIIFKRKRGAGNA